MVKKANPPQKECYICGKIITGKEKLCSPCQVFYDGVLILNFLPFYLKPEIDKEDIVEMLKNPEIVSLIKEIQDMSAEEVQNNISSIAVKAFEKIDQLKNKDIIPTANRYFQAFLDFKTRTPVKKADVYEEDVRRARLEISKGELLPNLDNIEISKEDLDVMASFYRQYYSMDYFQAYISTKNPILKLLFSHVISLRPLISRFKQYAIKNKDYSKKSESLRITKELENALENTDPLLKQIESKVKNADKQNLFDIINKLKKE